METQLLSVGIKAKDLTVMISIINNHPGKSLAFVLSIAKRLIKDINIQHAIVLGYLIGYFDATEQTHSDYSNSLQLCQRQN